MHSNRAHFGYYTCMLLCIVALKFYIYSEMPNLKTDDCNGLSGNQFGTKSPMETVHPGEVNGGSVIFSMTV